MHLKHKLANWLRSARGIGSIRGVVDQQVASHHELREAVQSLFNWNARLAAQNTALQHQLKQELAELATRVDRQAHAHVTERVDDAPPSHADFPRIPRAGSEDSATWLDAGFEESCGGPRAQVRDRRSRYVERVALAYADTGKGAVDVGSGRGEWLELMRDAAIPATGIDSNAHVVEQCQRLALDVVHDDAIAYLTRAPEASLGAITAFHVVEHLPLAAVLRLLLAAHRALAPGGVLILETSNPENLVVGAHTFHMNPSHVRPFPPPLLRFLVEAAALHVEDIHRLHPDEDLARTAEKELWPAGLRELMCGSRDFAIVARRPADG